MDEITSHQEKPLHELLDLIAWNVSLQLKGIEVAKPYIQGRPGGGKTACIIDMCNKYNWNCFHVHLALIPIEDISGLPIFEKIVVNGKSVDGTRWSFPEILSEIYKRSEDIVKDPRTGKNIKKPCIVFLDDMHLASPSHLNLGFELFSSGKLRTHKTPENIAFILAGNNSQSAGTKSQNSAITNRLGIYPANTSFEYWKVKYARPHGINDKILSFLNKDTYRRFFHEPETASKAWGSPRSWTYLSNFINVLEEASSDGEIDQVNLSYIANAHVSGGASSAFVTFYHIYSKTQMDKVFDGTKPVKCPEEELDKYIYMIAAGNEYVNRHHKETDKNLKEKIVQKVCEIISAVAENSSEIAVSGVKEILELETSTSTKHSSYIQIARTLKIMGGDKYKKIAEDIRKIAGTN